MAAQNEITPAQLARLIGTPQVPIIVDISIDPDFDDDPYLIPGAFRHPHTDLPGLKDRLRGRACVVTCPTRHRSTSGRLC